MELPENESEKARLEGHDEDRPSSDASLWHAVQWAMDSQGALARAIDGFYPREGQVALAHAVARTLECGGVLVAEAATGVGKTFAYLVPALLSGERVLLSTATKTLQEQLYRRDLPHLLGALKIPAKMALLKGRSSYLCLHRMAFARQNAEACNQRAQALLAEIERWAPSTRSGDLAELFGLDDHSPAIALVTSTRENCLGSECPQWRACYVNLARRQAMAADVVVINHHLFFADLVVRESGMAELLPAVRVAIFDEAHQLNETGIQFLGRHLTSHQLLDLARDLHAMGLQHARGLADWAALASGIELATRQWRLTAQHAHTGARLRWYGETPEGIEPVQWQQAMAQLQRALADMVQALSPTKAMALDLARLQERAAALADQVALFCQPCEPTLVRWVDVSMGLRLVESPLDIAQAVRSLLLGEKATIESTEATRSRAWVFVSATLGDDEHLSWFTKSCGLEHAEVLRIGSPFDYARQAALYVPMHMPRPADARHNTEVARLVGDAALQLGGRTMVLTTTLRALKVIGDMLTERLTASRQPNDSFPPLEVLVQGRLPKRMLLERFRRGASDGEVGCVLVASASFWEGVDLPGKALQLVVIDKLPFPPPGDPLVEARCRRLESEGRSAFTNYSVPEAAMALKQGVGRLIRRETDHGLLVICDTRLASMSYGRRLMAALPPMQRLTSAEQFKQRLNELSQAIEADT